jgi:hypothetical protein
LKGSLPAEGIDPVDEMEGIEPTREQITAGCKEGSEPIVQIKGLFENIEFSRRR